MVVFVQCCGYGTAGIAVPPYAYDAFAHLGCGLDLPINPLARSGVPCDVDNQSRRRFDMPFVHFL